MDADGCESGATPELGGGGGAAADVHPYTDNTGVDLRHFIVETLHRNYKDRTTLLRIEQEMTTLARDSKRTCHRFPAMSSYHRMLVHRVAAYFGMEHNVDQTGSSPPLSSLPFPAPPFPSQGSLQTVRILKMSFFIPLEDAPVADPILKIHRSTSSSSPPITRIV